MNLQPLKEKLKEDDATLVAQVKGEIYESHLHGIGPILNPMKENLSFFEDGIVVDRVIGKATAMLLILSKVKYIYAYVMSEKAKEILDMYHIDYGYEETVPYIINRTHDGMCPMEKTVYDMTDLNEAFVALKKKQNELMSNKNAS